MQCEHTPAQGPACRHKPRASRSAAYRRFAAKSRQRLPSVPWAMPAHREEPRTRDPADPGHCGRFAAATWRAAAQPMPRVRFVPLARVPRLCSRLSTPLAVMNPAARCGRMHTAALQQAAACNPSLSFVRHRDLHGAFTIARARMQCHALAPDACALGPAPSRWMGCPASILSVGSRRSKHTVALDDSISSVLSGVPMVRHVV